MTNSRLTIKGGQGMENKFISYEQYKEQLREQNLPPQEYDRKIREYCEKHKL